MHNVGYWMMSAFWKGRWCECFVSVPKTRLTFKESKFPIFPFKSSIDMSGQSSPKVTNRHGISIQNMVVTYPPEPFILKETRFINSLLGKLSHQQSNKGIVVYLKHKHFSSEDADGVEVPITDVGTKARHVWGICGIGAMVWRTGCYRRGLRAWSRSCVNKDMWKWFSETQL